MRSYFLRRALLIIPTLVGVTFLVFLITRFAPGGPVEQAIMRAEMAGDRSGTHGATQLSDDQVAQLKAYFGYDRPPVVAYFQWLGRLLHGDLGQSFRYGEPVGQVVAAALPITLTYGLLSLILTYALSIPMGIVKAMRHRTWLDSISSSLVFIAYAIPGYAVGALLVVYLSARFGWFPMGGFVSDNWSDLGTGAKIADFIRHAVLPLTSYSLAGFAFVTLLAKNQLLDNLAADYVRTAVAKGASFRRAVMSHAFRNSLVPLVTDLGQQIAAIVIGSVLIETIFDINGMGLLFFNAVVDRDPMVVMGVLLVDALLLLVCNLASDMMVALVDPRVRFEA